MEHGFLMSVFEHLTLSPSIDVIGIWDWLTSEKQGEGAEQKIYH